MANLKEFFNRIANNNKIYTAEDIGNMTSKEFAENAKAIDYQLNNIGIPRQSDLTNNADVVYVKAYTKDDGTKVKAHYRSKLNIAQNNNYKANGNYTGAAANINQIDDGFNKPLNIYIKGYDTGIPNLKNYSYYNNLNTQLEYEVGNFLTKHTNSPKLYSNDIRHQYGSALYARNFDEKTAKWLGDLNEILHFGKTGSGNYDSNLDQLNNEIGRNYAKKYPNMPKEQLLQILLNDWEKNSNYTQKILKKQK